MQMKISQLPLADRIPALKTSILAARGMKENYTKEEAELMEELAQAEAQVLGGEGEGVELSGLIPDGENPHYQAPSSPDTGASAPTSRRHRT